jgi:hypothetical protein
MIKILKNNKGQAMLETLIVLPVVVFFILLIIQVALMYNAKLITNYAAFCATRAAVVYNGDSQKAHNAAAIALSCVSPPLIKDALTTTQDLLQNIQNIDAGNTGPDKNFGANLDLSSLQSLHLPSIASDLTRYPDAYLRTVIDSLAINEKDSVLTLRLKYFFHCQILPLGGKFRGDNNTFTELFGLIGNDEDEPAGVKSLFQLLFSSSLDRINLWNVPMISVCKLRYWPGMQVKWGGKEQSRTVLVTQGVTSRHSGDYHYNPNCEYLHLNNNKTMAARDFVKMPEDSARDKLGLHAHSCHGLFQH